METDLFEREARQRTIYGFSGDVSVLRISFDLMIKFYGKNI